MRQKIPDDISYEIRDEFDHLYAYVKKLELFVEENLYELKENVEKDSISSLVESLNDFLIIYDDFLSNVISIAGEVRGYSKIGAEKIRHLERIKEQVASLVENLKELAGFAKEYTTNRPDIQKIKTDLVKTINGSIRSIRKYISEQLESDLRILSQELQKMERYYESYKEEW